MHSFFFFFDVLIVWIMKAVSIQIYNCICTHCLVFSNNFHCGCTNGHSSTMNSKAKIKEGEAGGAAAAPQLRYTTV